MKKCPDVRPVVSRRTFLRVAVGGVMLAGVPAGCGADGKLGSASSRVAADEGETKMNGVSLPEPIANYHCECGENPLWDEQRQLLYWTDIPTGRLFRYDARADKHEQIYSGEPVGGFTLQKDGSLLLFQVNKFSLLLPEGKTRVLVEDIDDDMDRFNDVMADAEGRVYAGTLVSEGERGGLYRVETDGTITNLFKGTACSNGMGFSPDGKYLYWTCSMPKKTIFRFDYDRATGDLTNRLAIMSLAEGEGLPDGLTIDAEGNIWSARWEGAAVYQFTPAGEPIGKIDIPVPKVTSAIFGGPNLDELYITTAGGSEDSDTADGTLYRVKVNACGVPEFRSNVQCDSN